MKHENSFAPNRNVSSSERKSIIANLMDRFNMVAEKRSFSCSLSGGQASS